MKFIRTPLILVAVLLVLGGLATWDEWQTEKEQKEKEEASKLTTLDAKQVHKITLVDRAQQDTANKADAAAKVEAKRVALEMIDGVWRVVAPLEIAADEREVSDFIKTVLDYKYEEEVISAEAKNVKLEEFGLQEPRRVITLQAEDGSSYELRLGNNAPVGYSTYFQIGGAGARKRQKASTSEAGARKRQKASTSEAGARKRQKASTSEAGARKRQKASTSEAGARKRQKASTSEASGQEQIYLGSQYVLNSTNKGLFNFRDKQLLALDVEKVAGVTFWHRESQAYEVTRQDGRFQLLRPEPFKTAQQKVSEYIEAFGQVRAEKFIDTPDAELVKKFKTASKIVMSAVFEFSSGESKELTFVRDRGELLAAFASDKLVFGLPASFEEKVRDLSENFRDHSIFAFAASEVVEIDVDGESYRRVSNDWYRSAELDAEGKLPEENKPVPNDSVDLLLDSLETAEAIEFADHKKVAEILAQPPARRITLQIERESKTAEKDKLAEIESDKKLAKSSEASKLEIHFHAHSKNEEQYYVTYNNSEQVYIAARSLLEAYTVSSDNNKDSALSNNPPDPQGG